MEHLHNDYYASGMRMQAAQEAQDATLVATLKPKFGIDGNQYYFLYGENLQDGVAGFGDTPNAAMLDFNKSWYNDNISKPIKCRVK